MCALFCHVGVRRSLDGNVAGFRLICVVWRYWALRCPMAVKDVTPWELLVDRWWFVLTVVVGKKDLELEITKSLLGLIYSLVPNAVH